jgi:hypothetical protein
MQNIPVPPAGGATYYWYFRVFAPPNQAAGTYGGTLYVAAVEHGTSISGTPHT